MQWYYGSGPTVDDADGDPDGCIRVVADGKLLTRNWWAIVLPGI
jgi:hypothetical protein